jgi:hypothetical protein
MPASINRTESRRGFPGSSFKYTPLQHVRVLFINFVRGIFAAAPPSSYRWVEDEETSEIIIRDENPINVDKYGARPCINFTPGRAQFYSLGMDDLVGYRFQDNQKVKSVLVPSTMAVNVSARSDIEAHNLAWVVGEHIWLLRDLLLREGFFELGRGIDIAPPGPPGSIIQSDQADSWYASVVSVPWQFARTSAFTPLAQRIVNSINTQMRTRLRRTGTERWSYATHGWPWGLQETPPPAFAPDATDAHGATPDPTGTRDYELPKLPHPLNPAKTVVVRTVNAYRSGPRPASMRGRTLPIAGVRMEESL